jgi:hypothetical protein
VAAEDKDGFNACMHAAANGHPAVLDILLRFSPQQQKLPEALSKVRAVKWLERYAGVVAERRQPASFSLYTGA